MIHSNIVYLSLLRYWAIISWNESVERFPQFQRQPHLAALSYLKQWFIIYLSDSSRFQRARIVSETLSQPEVERQNNMFRRLYRAALECFRKFPDCETQLRQWAALLPVAVFQHKSINGINNRPSSFNKRAVPSQKCHKSNPSMPNSYVWLWSDKNMPHFRAVP